MQLPDFHLAPGSLELLQVSGPDAVRLLQGQLTCDVAGLEPGHWLRGAACNNKGRVIATFLLLHNDEHFLLVFNAGVRQLWLNSINRFLPFYKCSLRTLDDACTLHGILAADVQARLRLFDLSLPPPGELHTRGESWVAALDDTRVLLCVPANLPHDADLLAGLEPITQEQWLCHEMASGHFPFTPEDHERYTPQELHLDRMAYVSFTKGCYTGQEIVARMHYRGKPKKQLYLVRSTGTADPDQTLTLHDAEGNQVGVFLKRCRTVEGRLLGLAPLPIDLALDTGAPALFDANRHALVCEQLPDVMPR